MVPVRCALDVAQGNTYIVVKHQHKIMANEKVDIDPRYLSYSKDEVEAILKQVEKVDAAPKPDSDYPVSSSGVFAALHGEYYER